MNITKSTLKALEKSGIVEVKAVSGADATVETAALAPGLCQVHALSGRVYDLKFKNDRFELREVK